MKTNLASSFLCSMFLLVGLAGAIDSFNITFFGLSAKQSFSQMRLHLKRQGFIENVKPGEIGTVNHFFNKPSGEEVLIVTINGKFLAARPDRVGFKGKQLKLGDPQSKLENVMGSPDEKRKSADGYELVYEDQKQQVPVSIYVSRERRVLKFELSPGRFSSTE